MQEADKALYHCIEAAIQEGGISALFFVRRRDCAPEREVRPAVRQRKIASAHRRIVNIHKKRPPGNAACAALYTQKAAGSILPAAGVCNPIIF